MKIYFEKTKFPSPFGDIYFSTLYNTVSLLYQPCSSFRPLSGISISLLKLGIYSHEEARFRPLSGISISLPGRNRFLPRLFTFPSPFGDIYFSTENRVLVFVEEDQGFRPLSGISISLQTVIILSSVKMLVSVPFRGYLFLYENCPENKGDDGWFPSPFGDIYFSTLSPGTLINKGFWQSFADKKCILH